MAFGDLKSKLSNAKEKVTETTKTVASASSDQLGKKLDSTMEELNGLRPLLKESGFIIGDISLALSIPPSLGIVVEQEKEGVNRIIQVMDENELSKFQEMVMGSIKKIYNLDEVAEKHDYTIGQIEIALSIPPKITAHLNSKSSRSFG